MSKRLPLNQSLQASKCIKRTTFVWCAAGGLQACCPPAHLAPHEVLCARCARLVQPRLIRQPLPVLGGGVERRSGIVIEVRCERARAAAARRRRCGCGVVAGRLSSEVCSLCRTLLLRVRGMQRTASARASLPSSTALSERSSLSCDSRSAARLTAAAAAAVAVAASSRAATSAAAASAGTAGAAGAARCSTLTPLPAAPQAPGGAMPAAAGGAGAR